MFCEALFSLSYIFIQMQTIINKKKELFKNKALFYARLYKPPGFHY